MRFHQPARAAFHRVTILGALTAAASLPVRAQEHPHEHEASPYAGQELSEIPSLTQQEMDDLRAGAGMGFARPAELNSYPGPKHVLELAAELELDDDQRDAIHTIQGSMLEAAVKLGEQIIEAERQLNRRFEHQHIDETSLREITGRIATLYGELRYVHLAAHLAATRLLTAEQVARYDALRGYTSR